MIRFFEFYTAQSKILLTAWADELVYNLSLIKLYLACVKQNTAVKTAIDACSLLAKKKFSDLVGQCPNLLIINFEQVIKPFLIWNNYFTSFLPLVDCTSYKSTIKSNCILLSRYVRVSEWIYIL